MNIERTSNMFTANDSMETTKHCLEFMEFSDSNSFSHLLLFYTDVCYGAN